jgi:hypothetical protein
MQACRNLMAVKAATRRWRHCFRVVADRQICGFDGEALPLPQP